MAIFSCFDVETTSLDAKKGQVIEIAIVKVNDQGELLDEWMTLVGPTPIDIGRPDIHGIKSNWLDSAPHFKQIAGDISEKFDGSIPVAHNAPFDIGFLEYEYKKAKQNTYRTNERIRQRKIQMNARRMYKNLRPM